MQKTIEQLQADLDREKAYTTKLNRQIDRLRDQLCNTISLLEHERILTSVRRECESKLSEIKKQQQKPHNERGAGHKREATKVVMNISKNLQFVSHARTRGFSSIARKTPLWKTSFPNSPEKNALARQKIAFSAENTQRHSLWKPQFFEKN